MSRIQLGLTAAALVVAVSIAAVAFTGHGTPVAAGTATDLTAALERANGQRLDAAPVPAAVHVYGNVDYPTNPPLSGPHYPFPPPDGSYVGSPTPRKEMLVHALEHGRIEIQYAPGSPRRLVEQLLALFDEDPARMLLFENKTHMPYAVAATAWGHGVVFKRANRYVFDAIRAFRDTYRDRGPEYIPRPE